jgi:plastocyanin
VSLVGWLRDARAEYKLAERADRTSHLDSLPSPRAPTGTFALFGALFVLALILNSGIIPSGSASGSTGEASPGPSGSAAAGGSGAPGGSTAPGSQPPADVTVTAQGIAFDVKTISATAGKPLTIAFVNKDPSIPHDIEVADASDKVLFEGATITGVNSTVYSVPPLNAGTYKFFCKWHPNMVGELTAK